MIGTCSHIGGPCPELKLTDCEGCELMRVYAKYKRDSLLIEALMPQLESEHCGDCEWFRETRIGKNGAKVGVCEKQFKKSKAIYASSRSCKKRLSIMEVKE